MRKDEVVKWEKTMNKELQFLVYNTPEKDVAVNAVIKDETIWLTQKAMSELFDCSVDNISLHLKNIYAEGELSELATAEDFSVVQSEGSRQVKRTLRFYSLDAIISVGYRVNSRKATQFRIWATGILKEYMTKGFVLDDERLKQGKTAFGVDYFRELLERVRSIRASERRIWQQIRQGFRDHPRLLRYGTKQVPLCYHRADGCGDYIHFRRPHQAPYGSCDLQERPGRAGTEVRRDGGEELSAGETNPAA